MSETNPSPELNRIISAASEHRLPIHAIDWASSALTTTQSILDSIEDRRDGEPTFAQSRALANIYNGAINWLKSERKSRRRNEY